MNNYLLGSWVFVYLGVHKLRRSCSIACIVVLGALICLVRFTQYLLYFFLFRSSTLCHDNMRTNGSNIVFVFFFFAYSLFCSIGAEFDCSSRENRTHMQSDILSPSNQHQHEPNSFNTTFFFRSFETMAKKRDQQQRK